MKKVAKASKSQHALTQYDLAVVLGGTEGTIIVANGVGGTGKIANGISGGGKTNPDGIVFGQ